MMFLPENYNNYDEAHIILNHNGKLLISIAMQYWGNRILKWMTLENARKYIIQLKTTEILQLYVFMNAIIIF